MRDGSPGALGLQWDGTHYQRTGWALSLAHRPVSDGIADEDRRQDDDQPTSSA